MLRSTIQAGLIGSLVIASSLTLADNLTIQHVFQADTPALASEVNTNFSDTETAVNSKQDRVTGTCPAGQSIRVINADGTVTCEVDDTATVDFGSILSLVTVSSPTTPASQISTATANCPTGSFATGGSCAIISLVDFNGGGTLKVDEPRVATAGGPPVGWICTCSGNTSTNHCRVEANVVCAR